MCLFSRRELKLNDRGQDVLNASLMLIKHGSSIGKTMYFSIGMRSAVISFQKKNNLEPTGIIDKKTWKALRKRQRKYEK